MEKFSARQLAELFLCFALLFATISGCQKKTDVTTGASSSPSQSSFLPESVTAPPPPITGPVTPAVVNQASDSFGKYLHFPRDPAAAKLDSAVQFYCDI